MSIFDRLKTSLSDNDTSASTATPVAAQRSRFMGRDDDKEGKELPHKVVEKGLDSPSMIWLYVAPGSQQLRLVQECGSSEGTEMNATMVADLHRLGLCEGVTYHAGFDQYWKMPSHESLVRMPGVYHVEGVAVHRMRVHTKLVRTGEAQGLWLHVRVRTAHEVQAATEVPMV